MNFGNFFVRGRDNANHEVGRLLWAISVVAGIVYTGADLVINGRFDITQFGLGMGTLMAFGGVGIGAKDMANKGVVQEPGTSTETTATTTTTSTVEG